MSRSPASSRKVAAFSTASAINATLFSSARLTAKVADDAELPKWFQAKNSHHIPARAVVSIGVIGATLAVVRGLGQLVEAASLAFLFAFASVNIIAARQTEGWGWVSWVGALLAIVAAVTLIVRLAMNEPFSLGILGGLVLFATAGRVLILRVLHTKR